MEITKGLDVRGIWVVMAGLGMMWAAFFMPHYDDSISPFGLAMTIMTPVGLVFWVLLLMPFAAAFVGLPTLIAHGFARKAGGGKWTERAICVSCAAAVYVVGIEGMLMCLGGGGGAGSNGGAPWDAYATAGALGTAMLIFLLSMLARSPETRIACYFLAFGLAGSANFYRWIQIGSQDARYGCWVSLAACGLIAVGAIVEMAQQWGRKREEDSELEVVS